MALGQKFRSLSLHTPLFRSAINIHVSRAPYPRNISSQTENFHTPKGRWVWNNEINQKIRYTPFNVEGLQSIACQVASARRCTSMTRLGEGSFNRVFMLQCDNGAYTLPRCREFVAFYGQRGRHHGIPKVLAWDSSFGNPAAWPYIICEHLPGVTLDTKWFSIGQNAIKEVIRDIVSFETAILQESFSQHGSIFFADNVSEELRKRPLYAEPPTDPLRIDLAGRFRIGPTINREWWRGPYGEITADRGPCTLYILSFSV